MNKVVDNAVIGLPVVKTHRPLDQIVTERVSVRRKITELKAQEDRLNRELEELAASAHEAAGL